MKRKIIKKYLLCLSVLLQFSTFALVKLPIQAETKPSVTSIVERDAQKSAPQTASLQILSPTVNTVLDVPAATIVVQSPIGNWIELWVNDVRVPAALIGRTETNTANKTITQTWYGVSLRDGKNTIVAKSPNGASASVSVQVRGEAKKLTVESLESRIPADGRSTATIQGQLIDEAGNRSSRDGIVTLAANAGEFVGIDADKAQPGFQVKAQQGQFRATLRSSIDAKLVTIRATTGTLEGFTQLNFETDLRPSIATGVVDLRFGKRGTDYFSSLRKFLPVDRNNQYRLDAKAAVFTTGRIGNWLFTGAYNSSRTLNQSCDDTTRLFRDTQFCDQTYPVYGDSSTSNIVTPSQDSVYAKIERSSPVPNAGVDFAMWGDYSTEEFARRSQEFTATTRSLHGFKANYNWGNLQVTGLFANNLQGFQRDAIPPDGTSGFYFLSRRLLVEGSETIFLETEELNRPGTVLDRKPLARGIDYEIDYDRGSLLFRQPILRTDVGRNGETLVRRIIASYQYDESSANNNIYAGRLQYYFSRDLNRSSWVGATYFRENQGSRAFELYGADAFITIGSNAQLIAEYAQSRNNADILANTTGAAYRFLFESQITTGINTSAYYRKTDTGFSNNATTSFVPGQTRYGAQVTATVSKTTNLRAQYDREDNVGIAPRPLDLFEDLIAPRSSAIPGSAVDNSLTTISAGVQQRLGSADLAVDWLHRDRTDRLTPNLLDSSSDQLRSRFSVPISQTLTFLAQNETTLSQQTDAVYSDRTLLGLNWLAIPGVNVQLAQQFYTRGQFAGRSLTNLNVLSDYKLGRDTSLTGRYTLVGGANAMTTQGAIGLNHVLRLSPGLRMDLAYEHVFSTFGSRSATGAIFAQPYAPGQSASSLGLQGGDNYSVGVEYTDPNFLASARYEHRTSSAGDNTVITAGAAGKISSALTALLSYQQANAANQTLVGLDDTRSIKLGLAYRDPTNDCFNALFRYEYRQNPSTIPDTILLGSGTGYTDHLLALEAIYAPDWRWEFYGKFGLRSSTSFLASDLVGTSTIALAQARAAYRFGYRWDIAAEARWLGQTNTGFNETGWAIEAGYYLNPNLRLSTGYSFGRANDRDLTGSRTASGLYFGLTLKVNELLNGFGLQTIPQPKPQPQTATTQSSK